MLHVASGGGDLPALDIGDDGEQAPEVLAQIVDDIDNSMVTDEAVRGSNEVAVHVQSTGECSTGEETLQIFREQALLLLCMSGLSGMPQITLPMAEVHGAPLGLSLMGPRGSDKRLIDIAVDLLG